MVLIDTELNKVDEICGMEEITEEDKENLYLVREILNKYQGDLNDVSTLIQENVPMEEVKQEFTAEKETQRRILQSLREIRKCVEGKDEGEKTPEESKDEMTEVKRKNQKREERIQLPRLEIKPFNGNYLIFP
ncbi:laminin subunit alpha-2 [Lasius niger]|uniref:Laminin subunit alpha-2 n=1 Tax=Lasius niger TaxID=67767 RepID=A0A0J7JY60_LASNI|nr:laminin subunit alpha-2 [Lasius niger]